MVDLDLRAEDASEMDELVQDVKNNIKLRGTHKVNLYTISYADPEPALAKNIVQSLLTIFVEGSLGDKRKETDSAERFLANEVQNYEQRLREAEDRLKEFKKANLGMMPGQGGDYYQRMEAAQSELQRAELQLNVAVNRRDELKRQLESADEEYEDSMDLLGGAADGPAAELDMRIQNLQEAMDELLLKYTERHPDVIEIKRTIERLEERKAEEEALAVEDDAVSPGLVANPVRQQLKMVIGEAEAQVAANRAVLTSARVNVEKMKEFVDHRLGVETQLKSLDRDYSLIKGNYEKMSAKLESLRLSEKVDTRSDSVAFRVIDPPRVPASPAGPNRILFSSMVLGLGLAIGVALAFLLSQLRPTFDDRRVLNELTGITVLGSVNMVWTPEQKRKRTLRHLTFSLSFLGLLVCYAAIVSAFLLEVNFTSIIEKI
jgi:polysaccharide chain length determinant protein (PEP-CTERM system associated)